MKKVIFKGKQARMVGSFYIAVGYTEIISDDRAELLKKALGDELEVIGSEKKVKREEVVDQKEAAQIVANDDVSVGASDDSGEDDDEGEDIVDSSWTVAELKQYCEDNGLEGYSSLNKTELIEAINNGDLEPSDEDE